MQQGCIPRGVGPATSSPPSLHRRSVGRAAPAPPTSATRSRRSAALVLPGRLPCLHGMSTGPRGGGRLRAQRAGPAEEGGATGEGGRKRVAVVGAGFAGLATAYHLLAQAGRDGVDVVVYDVSGIGGGASGVAAGLLHPFTPKGKELWMGWAGVAATIRLLDAAQQASGPDAEPMTWQPGLLRVAKNDKQARDLSRNAAETGDKDRAVWGATVVGAAEAAAVCPGLDEGVVAADTALLVPEGRVLHAKRYMDGLWSACEGLAASREGRSTVEHVREEVESLVGLGGTYTDVVVAAGAAAGSLPETLGMNIPMTPSNGHVLDMSPPEGEGGYPEGAPALLGAPYLSAHGSGHIVVGATKVFGDGPCPAVTATAPGGPEADAAAAELLPKAAAVWPPLARWRVDGVRAGVRGLPPRNHLGSIPLTGRLPSPPGGECAWWVVCGLGARGLVYHALLGESVARAVLAGDETLLLPDTTEWLRRKDVAAGE